MTARRLEVGCSLFRRRCVRSRQGAERVAALRLRLSDRSFTRREPHARRGVRPAIRIKEAVCARQTASVFSSAPRRRTGPKHPPGRIPAGPGCREGAQDALSSASGKAAGTEDRGRTVPPVRAIRPTWAMRRGGRRLRRPRIRGTYFSASITRPISSGIRCSSCAV